jgi:hypothetical protein
MPKCTQQVKSRSPDHLHDPIYQTQGYQ